MNLYDETMKLLDAREQTLREIAEQTGLGFQWLSKVSQRRITNPTVDNLQRLYDFLSKQGSKAA